MVEYPAVPRSGLRQARQRSLPTGTGLAGTCDRSRLRFGALTATDRAEALVQDNRMVRQRFGANRREP